MAFANNRAVKNAEYHLMCEKQELETAILLQKEGYEYYTDEVIAIKKERVEWAERNLADAKGFVNSL